MADTENTLLASNKRAAGRELSRDNPGLDDEEEASEQETGTFKRASDEVLAGRKIVKVCRHQTITSSAPTSNPFAAVRLFPAEATAKIEGEKTVSEDSNHDENCRENNDDRQTENKADEAVEESVADEKKLNTILEGSNPELADEEETKEDKIENEDNEDTEGATAEVDKKDNGNENMTESGSFSLLEKLSSSQNAFAGFVGTGFSNSASSFGSIQKDEPSIGSGSLFGLKTNQPCSFGFSFSNNRNSSVFGTQGASNDAKTKSIGFPSMREVPVETGEENEQTNFAAKSVLFEFTGGGWKERGKGVLKLNVSTTDSGKARLVMRAIRNHRLVLNASIYPDMMLANTDRRSITFACPNSAEGGKEDGLSTFALKFKDHSIVELFRGLVEEHKRKTAAAVVAKTPDSSPKE
ncbi:nuclear pore complex protein NUP50A-like [Diospyros lotus]|uniref:nuclear pore complex protein NUP50A-like n=1 Tax=Diospyros lotus TaxID=55363 RepID=UPI002254AA79|nr:nuclear pore complex protein NUP50A-like [Diospyros lotus]XP_052181049.1 nuclear pore complex protein NUP50A-like [Diospyros lotus]XP_052181050.1 nuclear pore complex protein NUP50A-like [Diospyros lotus]